LGSDIEIVSHNEDRGSLTVDFPEKVQNFHSSLTVQGASGLVSKDKGRAPNEGSGDSDSLALTAGEFIRAMSHALREADAGEGLLHTSLGVGDIIAVKKWEGHVFYGGAARKEIETLIDKSDFAVPDTGLVVIR
jgi:hypothetical protein